MARRDEQNRQSRPLTAQRIAVEIHGGLPLYIDPSRDMGRRPRFVVAAQACGETAILASDRWLTNACRDREDSASLLYRNAGGCEN